MEHTHRGLMAARTVLVTGATPGIGTATAPGLATMGAHVAITGRDPGGIEDADRGISAAGGIDVEVSVADVFSEAPVPRLAREVPEGLPRIDVLVSDAFFGTRPVTADGLQRTFTVIHLAPFLLTSLLRQRLELGAPARVVIVAPNTHAAGCIDFDLLQGERSSFGGRAYRQSKLGKSCSAISWLDDCVGAQRRSTRRLPESCGRPSGLRTAARRQRLHASVLRPMMWSPARGAATSIHLVSAPELDQVSGRYFGNRRPTRSSARSGVRAVAARLSVASAGPAGVTAAPHV